MIPLQEMLSAGMVGAASYDDAFLYQVQENESLPMIAARFGVTPEDIVMTNPEKPRRMGPYGWTFADIGYGEPLWLPPWITLPMGIEGVGVGAAQQKHFGVGMTFHPDAWNFDECTYTVQDGDGGPNDGSKNSFVNLYKISLGELNQAQGGSQDPAKYWATGKTISVPLGACNVARKLQGLPPVDTICPAGSGQTRDASGKCVPPKKPDQPCDSGYHKDPNGSGKCLPGGGGTPGVKEAGIFGSIGALLAIGTIVGLGALILSKKDGGRGASHATSGHRQLTQGRRSGSRGYGRSRYGRRGR